ncbi:MAG TPA: cytochrome c peroxidase [Flavipsychrobacter sp.]|nr:cytochrome c peroxidase [Flavipsychrobacter sp.]
MKKHILIAVLLIAMIGSMFYSCKQKTIAPEKSIAQTLSAHVDSFVFCKNKLIASVEGNANEAQLQQLFLQARLAYKKFEWAAEYFSPATARLINGPPVEEVEISSPQVFEPEGLQVIEGYLFPKYNVAQKAELIRQLKMLQVDCDKYKSHFDNIDIFDWQVFDATKLEVFRIMTLGITGFDDPLSQNSMIEAATSLESVRSAMAYYTNKDGENLLKKIDMAVAYLKKNTDFNFFNRAAFITGYGNAITSSMTDLEKRLKIHVIKYNRLLNQDAKNLFDSGAFNVNAYAPDEPSFVTDKKIALGKKLFADPILSGDNKRSCQSCHQPEKAFTDGLMRNTIFNENKLLARNTPTLLNAALQPSQFYDLRVTTLEDQSLGVVQNKNEMHGSMTKAASKIWKNKTYRQMFSDAFPKKYRTYIDTFEVMNAIASYVRSLISLDSRFDKYMRGDKTAMSEEEINGFNLFMGKAKCGTCHYMPLFNGTFPPRFIKIETEVIGVPQLAGKNVLDSDMGRYNIVRVASFKHSFKTPTVRNASRTAPYMHNGAFATLEQVLDFYNKGGGNGLGLKMDNQTLPFDKLDLTQKESKEIIAFIKSLDSK